MGLGETHGNPFWIRREGGLLVLLGLAIGGEVERLDMKKLRKGKKLSYAAHLTQLGKRASGR